MWVYTLLPKILNMSLTAGIVIVLVLLARILLRKAPKIFSYALWAVVLFRLVCPVSFSSEFSLLGVFHAPAVTNGSITYIPANIVHTEYPQVDLPIHGISKVINDNLPQGEEQTVADPLEWQMAAATMLWLGGIATMLIYSAVSLLLLRRRLIGAVRLRDNIYLSDHTATPFVIGVIRPKIYLPSSLTEQEQSYIILHEQTHIRRLDHIIKMIAFLAFAVHWFNPLVWAAFVSCVKDMEMSCDERVLKEMGGEIKQAYSASLLSLATGRHLMNCSPLAFGEGNIKGRIKNVMNFKKPAAWGIAVSVVLVAVLSVGLAVNSASGDESESGHLHVTDIEKIEVGTPTDEVHKILGDPTGQLSGFWGDVYELDGNIHATIYYDANGLVEQVKLLTDDSWGGNLYGKPMTLDDVRELAKKGDGLVFEDFAGFKSVNASSNLDTYIMVYGVEDGYRLIVNASISGGKPDRADLQSIWGSGGIDIRYNNVDEFIFGKSSSASAPPSPAAEFKTEKTDSVKFFVTTSPVKYTPAMSSTPGLRLDITYDGPTAQILYEAETGGFLTWQNSVIEDLGNSVTRPAGASALYWRPNSDTPQDDVITFTILNEAGEKIAGSALAVMKGDDGFFTAFSKSPENVDLKSSSATVEPWELISRAFAEAFFEKNTEVMKSYLLDPDKGFHEYNLGNGLSDIESMKLKFNPNDIKSDSGSAQYEFKFDGDDSYTYLQLSMKKVNDVWKIESYGLEK